MHMFYNDERSHAQSTQCDVRLVVQIDITQQFPSM